MSMAFISSFRVGRETVYPDSLRERLRNFPLLADVGDTALRRVLSEANWFGLPGGMLLKRDGENARALFLVVTGVLGVFVEDEKGAKRLVAQVGPGETVGEMSLISGEESHSAQLVALRDSELLRISPEGFNSLITRHPLVMMNLMRVLVKRLQETTQTSDGRCTAQDIRDGAVAGWPWQRTRSRVASQPCSPKWVRVPRCWTPIPPTRAPNGSTSSKRRMTSCSIARDAPDSAWTQLCLRQADRILLLAEADRPLPLRPLDLPAFKERATGLPELLLLHPTGRSEGLPEHFALRSGLFESHHHVRAGNAEDIRRLARFISGRAIGLVLAGGGARGFAHIGVMKALLENNVPFDHLGGTSMGAIIAAGVALEWSLDELSARMRDAFVKINPLNDYTIPLIALVRGKKVSNLLQEHFGDVRIEEMPRPFFLRVVRSHVRSYPCPSRRTVMARDCVPASRCREFCHPSPITDICWSMAG